MWDIIVEKNGLFKTSSNKYASDSIHNGMKLVILEVNENDGTSDVNIICPTAIYSNSKYSSFKKTIIIIKHGEFYEPVCFYSEKGKNATINVAFSKNDNDPESWCLTKDSPIYIYIYIIYEDKTKYPYKN